MNSLYTKLNPMAGMMEQFNKFKESFHGDAKSQVMQMLNSGQIPRAIQQSITDGKPNDAIYEIGTNLARVQYQLTHLSIQLTHSVHQ